MLTEGGVFGSFSTFKLSHHDISDEKREQIHRELRSLVSSYQGKILVEAYLTSGLSSKSDFVLRLHSNDVAEMQSFLLQFSKKSSLAGQLSITESLLGATKTLNYITKDANSGLNASLFATPYSGGEPKYAIIVPIKKNAHWWNLSKDERMAMIENHTIVTLPYLANVKRKLYHATGLCDADFITYFETNDLVAFHQLMLCLAQVPENTYHVRWGDPTIVATKCASLEAAIDSLI